MLLGRLVSLILVVALSLGQTPALARQSQTPDLDEARQAYWEGRFEESIQHLESLLDRLGDAPALQEVEFLLGLNRMALGEDSRADAHFKSAVTYDPSFVPSQDIHPPDVIRAYEKVRAELVGQLVVDSEPPGAKLLLAGRPIGETPYKGEALAGDQTIRAELEGYVSVERVVAVAAGSATTLAFSLSPQAVAAEEPESVAEPRAPKPAEEFQKVKMLVTSGDKTKETDVVLVLDNDRVVVRSRKERIELKTLAYQDIKNAEYTYSKHPRWKEGIGVAVAAGVFAIPLFFMKGKKHWLTLQTENDYAILRLDKRNHELVCLAFETHSGLQVEIGGEN